MRPEPWPQGRPLLMAHLLPSPELEHNAPVSHQQQGQVAVARSGARLHKAIRMLSSAFLEAGSKFGKMTGQD